MKQFTFEYSNQPQLISNLNSVSSWIKKNKVSNIWIQAYVADETTEYINPIADAINLCLPDAKYMITHAGMGFASGLINSTTAVIICNLFEEPDTKLELRQYPFAAEDQETTTEEIIEYVKSNPWIKMISFNCGSDLSGIKKLNKLAASVNPDIVMSGGAAASMSMSVPSYVLSSDGPMSTENIVLTYIGGENFHAKADVIVGWKGIGKEFTITKSDGALVYEIDGQPAFDVYRKYFKMECDPGLIVYQTIEFPLCFIEDNYFFIRCPLLLNADGSMTMMLDDLHEGRKVRLSFGTPDVIMNELAEKLNAMAKFEPQYINVNSCIGRRIFWGEKITNELSLLDKVAPSGGFLTGGEVLRYGDRMLIFNETIIVTAMREGDVSPDGSGIHTVEKKNYDYSLTIRLSSFIDTVTSDLEKYSNEMKHMAITDVLTGLYSRREIESRIDHLRKEGKQCALILLDLDNFKHINDTFGHKEGDKALCLLSDTIKNIIGNQNDISAGRWGGDEFMVVLENGNTQTALAFAEELKKNFYSTDAYDGFGRTLSMGIASAETNIEYDTVFQRADEKLYQAKAQGKARIVY